MARDLAKSRISVVGAGLMGHGIAQVFALAGHDVTLTDAVAASLNTAKSRIAANLRDLGEDESAVARVRLCADLAEAVGEADFVVEAVSEDLLLKQKLFAEIEAHVRADTILASNTSVIPITSIMQGLAKRERALGTHWWNPPFLVPLVEVIETQWTAPQTIAWTMALHEAAGKKPAHVKKDVPGFHRQPAAARALARSHLTGRAWHLRCRDGRCRHQGLVRPPSPGARPAGKRRSCGHRSHARHPQHRAAGDRQPAAAVALSAKARDRRETRFQVRRRLSQVERRTASHSTCQGDATSQIHA